MDSNIRKMVWSFCDLECSDDDSQQQRVVSKKSPTSLSWESVEAEKTTGANDIGITKTRRVLTPCDKNSQ